MAVSFLSRFYDDESHENKPYFPVEKENVIEIER